MKPIIDISAHQPSSLINYDQLANAVDGVILRACYGMQAEREFENHYREFKARGVPIGAYHYIVEYRTASEQVDYFARQVAGKELKLGYWCDVELENNAPKLTAGQVEAYMALVEAKLGTLGIYTSISQWQAIFGNRNPFADRKLWVAYYTTGDTPLLPFGWQSWWLWQYSNKGGMPGYNFDIDKNRWHGTDEEYRDWIGDSEPVEPPAEPLFKVRVIADIGLKYRACPAVDDVQCPKVGTNKKGAILSVYEERNGWYRIHSTLQWWSMAKWTVRVEDETPPDEPPEQPPVIGDGMYYGATYWQRDPRWRDKPLGTKSTIGANGCAMVCTAIAMNALGLHENPVSLNDWMTANGGYANGNLIIWQALERKHPTVKWDSMVYRPSDALLAERIMQGRLPIIVVDFNESTPQQDMHWVVGVGVDNAGNVIIFDPWDNTIGKYRSKYRKPTERFTSYSRLS